MSKLNRAGEKGMPGKTNYSKTFTAALLTLLFGVAGAGFGPLVELPGASGVPGQWPTLCIGKSPEQWLSFEEISRAIVALSLWFFVAVQAWQLVIPRFQGRGALRDSD